MRRIAMYAGERAPNLLVAKRREPPGLRGGIVLDPFTNGVNYEHVGEARDHSLAPGPQLFRLRRHEAKCALNPLAVTRTRCVHRHCAREERDKMPRSRMSEVRGGAHER